jgi:mannose-6-phosphate isomerase-like protein (cupin superfamily)
MQWFDMHQVDTGRRQTGEPWQEFLRVPDLSAGLYALAPGAVDGQRPHSEDELYYIIAGRGQIRVAGEERSVYPGVAVFVAAHVEHHFHSIEEELQVLVVFGPAEYTRANE